MPFRRAGTGAVALTFAPNLPRVAHVKSKTTLKTDICWFPLVLAFASELAAKACKC